MVKQGCSFSLFWFSIYVNPIFAFIKKEDNHKSVYLTQKFSINLIQTYAYDIILISKRIKRLKSLVNDADFFALLNIKLNLKICEILKLIIRKKKKLLQ
jgi:hypothetical protein